MKERITRLTASVRIPPHPDLHAAAALCPRAHVVAVLLLLAAITTGCASTPAPQFTGRWQPVNRFDETPQAIPLYRQYEFYASPTDRTLKNLLTRWAGDSQMTLAYESATDYTLTEAVSRLRTLHPEQAASELTSIYALQKLVVSVEGTRFIVRDAQAPAPASAASSSPSQDTPR